MIILASGSGIRRQLLTRAGVVVEVVPARVDEDAIRDAMTEAPHRDVADALAQAKALKVSGKHPDAMTLGCDQVLSFEGGLVSKAESPEGLVDQLAKMSGKVHDLISAAVVCEGARPVWRAISTARLHMYPLTPDFIEDYVARNWDEVRHAVGGYHIEGEGPRLFSRIEGDHFAILGLPLLQILSYLRTRGRLTT